MVSHWRAAVFSLSVSAPHLTASYQISDRDVPQCWHNLTYTLYSLLYRMVPVCWCMGSRVSKRHDQLLIVSVVGAELLEWLHVSRLIQPQPLNTVALISIHDTAGLNEKGLAGNKKKDVGEVHVKPNWLRQVTEVRLLREGQEDKQQERLAEKRRAAAWKRSELTTGRGDSSIGASPGALSEMEWARLCWVLLNSLQRCSEGPD